MDKQSYFQSAAQSIDSDVIVVANAGSGKTYLLVEHYFYLLAQGFSPQEIVAFTFTEKAALELKERILRSLPQQQAFKELPKMHLEGWKQKIMEAPIGTIHQFCLRVIQDDPGPLQGKSWEILEESAEMQMREKILRTRLESDLAQGNPAASRLLNHYGIAALLKLFRNQLDQEGLLSISTDPEVPELLPMEAQLLQDLEALSRNLLTELHELKMNQGRISFFDLEQLALERIRDHSPKKNRFWTFLKHILVDEFQDTSPIQIEILSALRQGPEAKRPKLYCVGDPKQSIYRFRNVNQTLIETTSEQILKEGGVQFDFTNNYRSTEALIDFVNEFSKHAFPESKDSQLERKDEAPGQVDFVALPDLPKGALAEDYRLQEAEWVTQQVQGLLAGSTSPEEIAILFRASASSRQLTKLFKERGIPFTIRGGRSLWERQEVLDLQNLLLFLDRPVDSLALLGVLRSPIFLLSDETLFWLTGDHDGKKPLWEHLSQIKNPPEAISSHEWNKFQWTLRELENLKQSFDSLQPGALLRDIIKKWGLDSLYSQIAQDLEPILAIEQFIHYLEGVEGNAAMERLRQLKRTPFPLTPLADQLESQSCIQLLTVHAAKGLEFSHVFLVDLDRPPPPPVTDIQQWGPYRALKLREGNETKESPRFQYLKNQHQAEEAGEALRLLYVALTRARDHLWIPVSAKKPRKGTLKALLYENLPQRVPKPIQVYSLESQTASAMEFPPALSFKTLKNPPPSQKCWSTVSELETLNVCALKHHYSYEQKLSDQNWQAPGQGPGPTELGTLIHKVLHEWSGNPKRPVGEILSGLLALNPLWNREGLIADLHGQITQYRDSEYFQPLLQAKESYSELPFLLNFSNGWVRGQIDRLIKIADQWHLVDFKTSQGQVNFKKIAEQYSFQLKTYALAARNFLKGPIPKVKIHLIAPPQEFSLEFSENDLHQHAQILNHLLKKKALAESPEESFKPACHQCAFNHKVPICPVPITQTH